MNNRGFTMIELLAAMVILSLLMIISVPTVLNLLDNNRKTTIVSDTKKLISNVEYYVNNNNNVIKRPRKENECIIINLAFLDLGNDFKNGPHGEPYSKEYSYVVVKRVGDNLSKRFEYYGTLVEKVDENSYYGLINTRKDQLIKSTNSKVGGISKDSFGEGGADGLRNAAGVNMSVPIGTDKTIIGCEGTIAVYNEKQYDG